MPESGLADYGNWLKGQNWSELYQSNDIDFKAEYLQNTLLTKFYEIFPIKTMKVSDDDQPWFTNKLKILDRKRKREYYKHQKSDLWKALNLQFLEGCKKAKEDYKNKIVDDLKTTNPKKWYSKVKRMSGQKGDCSNEIFLEEICHLSNEDQANQIADHFASTRNSYQRVEYAHFSEVLEGLDPDTFVENLVTPNEIQEVIKNLNKNSACVLGDVPMKIISLFSTDLSIPICNLINSIFESGCYPYL